MNVRWNSTLVPFPRPYVQIAPDHLHAYAYLAGLEMGSFVMTSMNVEWERIIVLHKLNVVTQWVLFHATV